MVNEKKALIEKEKSDGLKAIETLEGCTFFTRNMTEENFQFLTGEKSRLEKLSRRELKSALEHINKKLKKLVSSNKISALGKTVFRQWYLDIENKEVPERVLNFPKIYLLRYIADAELLPPFVHCPAHGLIEIPYRCSAVPKDFFGFIVPEIMLYESMAMMMNKLVELPIPSSNKQSKKLYKESAALKRSSLVFAYSFVEAYLNGLAARVTLGDIESSAREKVSSKNLAKIFEKDPKNFTRSSFVSFRDKALQYPRIAIGANFPPLTESNCTELKVLLDTSKIYRDAIAHPSFRADLIVASTGKFDFQESSKMQSLVLIPDSDVQQTVDAAVGFVLQVEELVGGSIGQFLFARDENGRFPDLAFA